MSIYAATAANATGAKSPHAPCHTMPSKMLNSVPKAVELYRRSR